MEISNEKVLTTLREVVATKGSDYVYPDSDRVPGAMCVYKKATPDGQSIVPSCIVGHVIYALDPERLPWVNEGQSAIMALEEAGLDVSTRAVKALLAAQAAQDDGKSWGEALAEAENQLS